MRLYQDKNWKSIHFISGRTLLRKDKCLYGPIDWKILTEYIEVVPLDMEGNYKEVIMEETI